MPGPLLILFDVDGTLVRSNGVGGRAWLAAGREVFGDGFTVEGLDFAGQLDRAMLPRAAAVSGIADHAPHAERFFEVYVRHLGEMLATPGHGLQGLPGAHRLLAELDAPVQRGDALLGVLTGNAAAGAWLKLAAAGFEPGRFTINAFGTEAERRPDLTALAMQRYAAVTGHPPAPRRVIVIGDTPADITCATAHGCTALGVTTGRHTRQALTTAGAHHVVDDLADAASWVLGVG